MAQSMTPLLAVKGILGILCMFFGAFGVFFSIWRNNYYAASGCLMLELTTVLVLNINYANLKGQLSEKFNRGKLTALLFVGIVVIVLTTANAAFCLWFGLKNDQGFQVDNDGFFFALIPNVLAWFWSLILTYDARRFRMLVSEYPNSTRMSALH